MLNPFKEINWNPGVAERRKFARSLVIGFPCVALLFLIMGRLHHGTWNIHSALVLGGAGVGVGLILLAVPQIGRPFYLVWYFVAACMGIILGNLMLALFFYVFVTILGLCKRALGGRSFPKHADKQAESYWQDAEQPDDPKRYYSQF